MQGAAGYELTSSPMDRTSCEIIPYSRDDSDSSLSASQMTTSSSFAKKWRTSEVFPIPAVRFDEDQLRFGPASQIQNGKELVKFA